MLLTNVRWRRKGDPLQYSCLENSVDRGTWWRLSIGSQRAGDDWSDLAYMHALEKEMATHSCVLAWRIPGREELGGSMGPHRVGHDWSGLAAAAQIPELGYKLRSISRRYLCFCARLYLNWTMTSKVCVRAQSSPACPWNSPGKNTGVGCHTSSALAGEFFTVELSGEALWLPSDSQITTDIRWENCL